MSITIWQLAFVVVTYLVAAGAGCWFGVKIGMEAAQPPNAPAHRIRKEDSEGKNIGSDL